MENLENLPEEESAVLTLVDENGADIDFEYLDCIEYQGKEYLVLLPAQEDSAEVVILEVEPHKDGSESFLTVNDEATLMAVFEIFKDRFQDIFTFEG